MGGCLGAVAVVAPAKKPNVTVRGVVWEHYPQISEFCADGDGMLTVHETPRGRHILRDQGQFVRRLPDDLPVALSLATDHMELHCEGMADYLRQYYPAEDEPGVCLKLAASTSLGKKQDARGAQQT